ncbi:MAG: hypothetical protein HFG00_07280 [Oscillibacter sp.]|nr:hypothetical protein [Oscillibacter sp.]
MKKNSGGLGTRLLMAVLFLGVTAYFALEAFQYLDDPLSITLAYRYQVENTLELSGYVVRTERVLPDDDAGGLLRIQRGEGERVAAGGVVAAVYAGQESLGRQMEMDALESRVEQLEYAKNLSLELETSRKLDAQIAQNLLEYRQYLTADRLYDAQSTSLELRALVLKRDFGSLEGVDLDLQLQELGAQLLALRSQAEGTVRRITAPESGLYSAETDGYESVLTPETLKDMTPSQFAALSPEGAMSQVGKLVLGDEWYYAAVISANEASFLQEQEAALRREKETLHLRFASGVNRDLPVTLESLGPRENGRVVAVFRGKTYLQDLTLLRQQRAEVLYGATAGIRVPKESLRAERAVLGENGNLQTENVSGVYCMVGRSARFKPVEVLYSGDSFVLVRSTAEKEDDRLRPGEEIILSARGLYDGKVLR